ncbi:VIT and vWA domain-containing protein [Litoreibacter roseus]|uniref:Inter-alpha-trypsin inhibitor domain-containing protein n=1 Tax=Litoreibacter roseus TaxID=2601869 RepID=A0A6N6JFV2_9RHOB|nr:VIT and VWA domain-containing protein [Litoreibacter roseus]GFE64670.1 inter-alpha-trypsin inhibitor domain-containing protein [Litoreibacter roseus]
MRLFFLTLYAFGFATVSMAIGAERDDIAGRVIAHVDGKTVDLPLLDSGVAVNIEGDMATVEITQTFSNPSRVPLEARYLFPLNQHAAVYGMQMEVGDEIVQAKIRKKAVAEAEFVQASQQGKAAALLTQHRPNMFTQRIANLMPGLPVKVVLRYVQMVPKIDGRHELVIPLIVGPRYESPDVQIAEDPSPQQDNMWTVSKVPVYPHVAGLDVPETYTSERVSLALQLISGVSVSEFGSATHDLLVDSSDGSISATFVDGKVMDNRDLVIHYTMGGTDLQAASLSHTDDRGGFLSVMVEPPSMPDDAVAIPRELVFVLDTSGSMGGAPLEASKRFMDAALEGLRPGDYFRVIPFSNSTQRFANGSTPATASNIRKGRRYVNGLKAGGGTEIDNAIQTAFATRQPSDTMRIVVFLSDGYIGDEARVLRTIRNQIGQARIYAFGVGNSVNRYLLDAMADEGRGYARYVGVDETAGEVADMLAADLKTPLLTDLSIDWGGLEVTDVTPTRLPDLFAGGSLRIYARHSGNVPHAQTTLKGLVQGHQAEMPIPVTLTTAETDAALPLIWARNRISDLTRQIAVGSDAVNAEAEITELGLAFSLQTRYTSFVAVSEKQVNASGQPSTPADVPLPMVSGVSAGAYPQAFAGSSSPEPAAIIGFIALALTTIFGLRRRIF